MLNIVNNTVKTCYVFTVMQYVLPFLCIHLCSELPQNHQLCNITAFIVIVHSLEWNLADRFINE